MQLTGIGGNLFVVTGAAQGIGEGIARALAEAGATLALVDLDREGIEQTAKKLGAVAYVTCWPGDISREEDVERVAEGIDRLALPVRGLINVAGIQCLGPLLDQPLPDFDAVFNVNLRGTYLMTRAIGRRLADRGEGAIVTISSNAARVPRVRQGAYCASKAAVSHLMRVFALELGPLGVRCNTVAPGSTETEMILRVMKEMEFGGELVSGSLESFRTGIPLGKNAKVADVAAAALFLLSDQAGHVTMHELVVDGGGSLGA